MTASRKILAFAAAAALGTGLSGWSSLAQAQSAGTTTPPGMQSTAPSSPATAQNAKPRSDAQVEARIKQLHSQLKITKDQENDWGAVAQDMRDNAQQMASLLQDRAAAKSKPMTAVDNLKNYEQIVDAQADGLKKITPDFEKLYDEMSPAQKKTADTIFNQRLNQRLRTTATPSSGKHS
ncbi:MAG TPA: Spy/CpxP family protein refolding chaperone [Stellaceae bacterium]|nr:Spy/CpxP family protein refolding chaperone [Stellaceae bacterium]